MFYERSKDVAMVNNLVLEQIQKLIYHLQFRPWYSHIFCAENGR